MERDRAAARVPFGRLLKRHRLAAGLSQEALAERAGLSWRTVSDLERGVKHGPRGSTLRLLADALTLGAQERAALLASAYPPEEVGAELALAAMPPLATVPTNLPLALTSFVGRKRELAALRRLLGETRLLTLTGAGGCGKTRLALEVARALAREAGAAGAYADGIWLVELAALGEGALVLRVVASALGVREQPGQPLPESLITFLQRRRLLLLLDNCEHLVGACAELVETLLRTCPQLTILATSREPLSIGGERPWQVPSLRITDPLRPITFEQVLASEAVRLFVQRAQVVRPEFAPAEQQVELVAEVCRRLDGLPLAIELAAARLAALSLEQLSARLEDRFRLLAGGSRTALPRQRTLRATLDWSYDLLNAGEQRLLARLSVFAGGWALEAAEAVIGAGAAAAADRPGPVAAAGPLGGPRGEGLAAAVLDLLAGLVNKSLVLLEEGRAGARYRLLETVRQYGSEQLAAAEEEAPVRDRHLAWCLMLAREADPWMGGLGQEVWLGRLDEDLDNLRAALAWSKAMETRQEIGLRLAEALREFWYLRGHVGEGRRWLEDLLQQPGAAAPSARARALDALGELVYYQGDPVQAMALHEAAYALHSSEGNAQSATWTLAHQARVAINMGEYQRAMTPRPRRIHLHSPWIYPQ